jgi:hypothetical protein
MPPRRSELLAVAIVTIAFRVAVFFTVTQHFGVSLEKYTSKGDTSSYVAYARAMLGDSRGMTDYDRRVFPGYPTMIAALGTLRVRLAWAALGITWVSAGVAASAAMKLFNDRRIGWAMVALIPHYPINSSLGMTEAPLLALTLAGLLLARKSSGSGGAVLGLAGLIRPVACFAVAGAIAAEAVRSRRRSSVVIGFAAILIVGLGVAILQLATGDALRGARVYANDPGAYAGQMIVWPLKSLIFTPVYYSVSPARVAYTWAHVVVTLTGCVILARRCMRHDRKELDVLSLVWLAGNTAFITCIGSYWGFQHFPRFMIPALPALFWAFRDVLPSRWYVWAVVIAAMFWPTVLGVNASL